MLSDQPDIEQALFAEGVDCSAVSSYSGQCHFLLSQCVVSMSAWLAFHQTIVGTITISIQFTLMSLNKGGHRTTHDHLPNL